MSLFKMKSDLFLPVRQAYIEVRNVMQEEIEIMTRYTQTMLTHAGIALAITTLGAVAFMLVFRLSWNWYLMLTAWLVVVNAVAFGYYGYDKSRAKVQRDRVPEGILHGIAALGGTAGAYLGMIMFRHKTVKTRFRVFFWLTVIVQVGVVLAILYRVFVRGG